MLIQGLVHLTVSPQALMAQKGFMFLLFFISKPVLWAHSNFGFFFFFLNSVILKKCGGKMGQKSHTEIDRQNLKMDLGRGF